MFDISNEINTLKAQWKIVNKSFIDDSDRDTISEFINTIDLLSKTLLIKKNSSSRVICYTYEAAKASSIMATNYIKNITTQIPKNHSNIQNICSELNKIWSNLHLINILASSKSSANPMPSLLSDLSNCMAQLREADNDIQYYIKQFNNCSDAISLIEEKKELLTGIIEKCEKANDSVEEIVLQNKGASSIVCEIKDIKKTTENTCEALQKEIEEKSSQLTNLINKCNEINNTIKSLLPKATSAGLAYSFSERANNLKYPKRGWCTLFIIIVLILYVTGWYSFSEIIHQNNISNTFNYWKYFFERLPFTAPLVWLAWFSAIQYGNTLRLQEDYAFKSTTAQAFVGYKDYFDHLSEIEIKNDDSSVVNAQSLLMEKTIRILSLEPSRILSKTHKDASFFSIFKLFSSPNQKVT